MPIDQQQIFVTIDSGPNLKTTVDTKENLGIIGVSSEDEIRARYVGIQGPPGAQGPAGAGFNWRGTWDPLETYADGDIVEFNGSSFIYVGDGVSNEEPPSADWDLMVTGGAGGDSFYIREEPMDITVGGAIAGTTFNGTVQDALDTILYPYVAPTFTAFSISSNPGTLEVGQEFAAATCTFLWSTSQSANVESDTINILSSSLGTLLTASANDGTQSIALSAIVNTTPATETFTIQGTNTQSATFARTTTINWRYRVFWGASANTSLTESEIEALTSSALRSSRNSSYIVSEAGYKYLAWPVSFGLASLIVDPDTGLNVAMNPPDTISVTNPYGVTTNYYLYRTTNFLNGALTMVVS